VPVEIKGTEVNQQLCWIRALEHDSTRWEAWLRLGEDLARSGIDSRAVIRGKTCSAVYCFARVAPMENSTVPCSAVSAATRGCSLLLTPTTPAHGAGPCTFGASSVSAAALCSRGSVECDQYDRATLWLLLASSMRDDEHVVVRGKRMSRGACWEVAAPLAKGVMLC
jgi:hypothetical protein